ncbi:MAG: N-acetylmuramoyl-L-alanine amidase [Clostridiales bacterium]|nr:N-acetylmuramoyl-L-alanine amidase [Clostridiales bacterium]
MQERLMRYTALITTVLALVSMAVMLRFASAKTIVIAEEVTAGSGAEQEYAEKKQESIPLHLVENKAVSPSVCIPLPEDVRPDDIVIENHYIEHRINVIIAGAETSYYKEKEINGGIGSIRAAACYKESDSVVLAFQMDGLYEHKYLLEEHALFLEFVNPHEMYDRIIVLDAGHGGADNGRKEHGLKEKDASLFIVEQVRNTFEDSGVRIYCTRQEDASISAEKRIAFINELRPDLVISVHLNASEEQSLYGTEVWYNEQYVIPVFGNVELADLLERCVVRAADGRANGLVACGSRMLQGSKEATEQKQKQGKETDVLYTEEEELLMGVRAPAAVLEAGYLTNPRERQLLEQEAYQKMIAEGICDAIRQWEEQTEE